MCAVSLYIVSVELFLSVSSCFDGIREGNSTGIAIVEFDVVSFVEVGIDEGMADKFAKGNKGSELFNDTPIGTNVEFREVVLVTGREYVEFVASIVSFLLSDVADGLFVLVIDGNIDDSPLGVMDGIDEL